MLLRCQIVARTLSGLANFYYLLSRFALRFLFLLFALFLRSGGSVLSRIVGVHRRHVGLLLTVPVQILLSLGVVIVLQTETTFRTLCKFSDEI